MIDFSGKRVIVFGGGNVGARKAGYFSGQSEVTVISRSFSGGFDDLPVKKVTADLSATGDAGLGEMICGAFLVIAATSDTRLNERIGKLCRSAGILFNNATGTEGDVLLPSKIEGRNYLIAISTGGESPGIARYLREHIGAALPGLDGMIGLQGRLRERLKKTEPDQSKRSVLLRRVLDDRDVWNAAGISEEAGWKIIATRYLDE